MSSELSKTTESYNNSGVFLQAFVVNKLNKCGWATDIEYPVTIAPFTTDPTRLHRLSISLNGHNKVNPEKFVNSMQESQNISQISERSLDVISGLRSKDKIILCIECKKLNPKYTEWCFFKHQDKIIPHVITKSMSQIGNATLFHVPETDRSGNEIFVELNRSYNDIGLFPNNIADYGIALTNEELWDKYYKTEQTVVDEACRQVIEGTYGLIIDTLKHQIITGESTEYQIITGESTEYQIISVYVPMIVTNTQLKICEYDKNNIDSTTGKLTKEPVYKNVDAVLLEYNSPKNVHFPNPMFSRLDGELRKATSKWYVFIMNLKGLDDFLNRVKNAISNGSV